MSKIRYNAEWITRQSPTDAADCDYTGEEFDNQIDAEEAAIRESKAANVAEWWAVTEEHYSKRYGWETVRRWVGDWSGNVQQTRGEAAQPFQLSEQQ